MDFAKLATDMLSQLGYVGLTIGLIVDSFGIPIPSEVLLAVGGALAATGRFNVWWVMFLGTAAQLVGGLVGYAIGRYGGYPFLLRYGKYVFISKRDLERTHQSFEKYGPWLTMAGRCLPVIRGLVAYPAGIARMNIWSFILYTTIGSAAWTALWVFIGYQLGENLDVINSWMHDFSLVVVAGLLLLIVWHFRHHWGAVKRLWRRRSR